jgi:hypothetical protein
MRGTCGLYTGKNPNGNGFIVWKTKFWMKFMGKKFMNSYPSILYHSRNPNFPSSLKTEILLIIKHIFLSQIKQYNAWAVFGKKLKQ